MIAVAQAETPFQRWQRAGRDRNKAAVILGLRMRYALPWDREFAAFNHAEDELRRAWEAWQASRRQQADAA